MCAIAGIINHHATPDVERIVRKMCNQQAHRGPDGSGFFCNDEIAFGHRRLAIIDPAHGAQPISNEDGSVTIDLHIIVDSGVNIAAISSSITKEVAYKVTELTGVSVASVEIYIDSISFS